MLELIASYLSGIWIISMLIAGYKRNELWLGIFMLLYIVSMALWGISWLNKKFDVKRKMAAAKEKKELKETPSSQPVQQHDESPAETASEPLFIANNAHGCLTVSVRKAANEFTVACSTVDKTAYQFTAACEQYTSSGLRFVLGQKGWPAWITDELANWRGIGHITRDSAAPDNTGKIYWENPGDLSRFHSVLWFEKTADKWWLEYQGSDLPTLAYPLPEATDEDIADYLQLSPKVFWNHPTIREQHWAHTVKKAAPPRKTEQQDQKNDTPAQNPEAPKPVIPSKQQLVHHFMSVEEQEKCDQMLKQLDEDLQNVGADRSFLDMRHCGNSAPRFGYAAEQGYYVVIQPERAAEIVPFVEKEERDFRRIMLREAADCGCGTGLFLTLTYGWGGRAEHGEEKLEVSYREKKYHFVLTSTEWNDAAPSAPPRVTTELLHAAQYSEFLRFTVSGFLFHMQTMHRLPLWASNGLKREKVFTSLFQPGTDIEERKRVYWSNAGNPQKKWVVWFEQRDSVWYACANVRTPELHIDKATPLPKATNRDIALLLCLHPFIYIHQPDIENWYLEDQSALVTLFKKASSPRAGERLTVQFDIDKRNGALYRTETRRRYANGDRGPATADEVSTTRPSFYQEMITQDIRFRGMTLKNWRNYLPSEERKQIEERIYQYHQDVQRGGTPPETAAANRDLVLIDGRPVPKEAAETAKVQEVKTKVSKSVNVYTHNRSSFYDEASSVVLAGTSVLVSWNTPNMDDRTVYPLPVFMQEAGFTRGELLTWLKSQRCMINFPEADLQDKTVLKPRAVLWMREELPLSDFGKKTDTLDVHMYTGSNCLSKTAVYQMKDGTEWLLSFDYWRDEHAPECDARMECAIRSIYDCSITELSKHTLTRMAERSPTIVQANMFISLHLYHEDIDPSEYGKPRKKLYDWRSTVGHDSQSWACRAQSTTLHKKNDCHFVIDRTLWIDGTTQKERWVTIVAQLKPGKEASITAEAFHRAIERLPYTNLAAW